MTIPRTIDDITPEWLSDALGRSVMNVKTEPIGVGVGLVGQLHRLQIDGDGGPATIIAKLAAATEEDRFVATVLNMYGREVGFYNELSARTTIAHPHCYFAEHDAVTQDCVLLLEDVSVRGRGGDQVAGHCLADARPAIRTLAACTPASGTIRTSRRHPSCCSSRTTRTRPRSRWPTTWRGRACRSCSAT